MGHCMYASKINVYERAKKIQQVSCTFYTRGIYFCKYAGGL